MLLCKQNWEVLKVLKGFKKGFKRFVVMQIELGEEDEWMKPTGPHAQMHN